jgi:hypothetical protein
MKIQKNSLRILSETFVTFVTLESKYAEKVLPKIKVPNKENSATPPSKSKEDLLKRLQDSFKD